MDIVQNEQDVYWIDHLDQAQRDAIEDMKKVLAEKQISLPGHDDETTLARFLKARKWDVPKAMAMYEAMLAFRREKGLDSPKCDFVFHEHEQVAAVYPHFYHKTDKWGRPVYYELLGELQATELMKVTTIDRLVDYHVHCWEHCKQKLLPACAKSVGRPIFTTVTILDLKNASMSQFTAAVRTFICAISKIDQDNYPEHLGQMFIVHAPMLFSGIWRIIKPWLEVRTQKKIHVLSCPKQSKAKLLDLIGEDNLLERFGGKSVLAAPYSSRVGPWAEPQHCFADGDKGVCSLELMSEKAGGSTQSSVDRIEAVFSDCEA